MPFNKKDFCDKCHNYVAVKPLLLGLPYRAKGEEVMSMNRREFLTIAGISTIAGIGGTALAGGLRKGALEAAQTAPNPDALTGKRG